MKRRTGKMKATFERVLYLPSVLKRKQKAI